MINCCNLTIFTTTNAQFDFIQRKFGLHDCNNFTNTCTIHLFITYIRLHVSASPGHHQGVTDYQRLQIKMRKYE
jgi:hypothetical protein